MLRKASSLQLSISAMTEVALEGTFEMGRSIGQTESTTITLARNKEFDREIVIKQFTRKLVRPADFIREYNNSFFLSPHPNIIDTFEGIFCTPDTYFFVQEFCSLGSLRDAVHSYGTGIPEESVKRMVGQVVAALEFMHSEKLVHRCLEAKNVLIFDAQMNKVKLCDLSMVRKEDSMVKHSQPAMVHAPELCDCIMNESYSVSRSTDIWSLGILIYYALRGRYPWEKATIMIKPYWEWEEFVKGKRPQPPPRWNRFSDRCLKLFRKMLQPKAKDRCSASEVNKYFKFRWIKEQKSVLEDDLYTPTTEPCSTGAVGALISTRRPKSSARPSASMDRLADHSVAGPSGVSNAAGGVNHHPVAKQQHSANAALASTSLTVSSSAFTGSQNQHPSSSSHASHAHTVGASGSGSREQRNGAPNSNWNANTHSDQQTPFHKRRSIIQSWLASTISAMAEISEQVVSATE